MVRSLYYIGPQIGHVTMFCTGCILGRATVQRRLCPIFVKLCVPVKGTQHYGIGLSDIHKFSIG